MSNRKDLRKQILAPNATVALANYFQFYRRHRLSFSRVESRMFIWCKSGYGKVTVNGTETDFDPDTFIFAPWAHSISYAADASAPFLVGCVHIIPNHVRNKKVELNVAHRPTDSLFGCPWRKDCELPGLHGLLRGRLQARSPLASLGEHIVESFYAGRAEEWQLRHQAQLLIAELTDIALGSHPLHAPLLVNEIMNYVAEHLEEPIRLDDLVKSTGYSATSIRRTFRDHVKMSPVQWIIREKIEHAARLLATTSLSITEAGRSVGIDDAYYFSRLFKKVRGVTASEWRRKLHL